MDKKLYFTRRGLEKFKREIKELTKKLENLQSQTTYVAEVGGDQYHDNASYEMLVIDIRGINSKITEMYRCLNQAIIVEPPNTVKRVAIGTSARIIKNGEESTWEIVGFGESDPEHKLIAYNTPLASLIIGKNKGEIINGIISDRQTKIEIIKIMKRGNDENK